MAKITAKALQAIVPGRWIRGYEEWQCMGERWSWTVRWSDYLRRWFVEAAGPPGDSFANTVRCVRRKWEAALLAVKRAADTVEQED